MLTVDHLLTLFGPFCEARRISSARLSTLLFNDGKRILLLQNGGDIGSRRLQDAFQWLSDHWPPDAQWPANILRPAPANKVAA
jgi:hypothetical protein